MKKYTDLNLLYISWLIKKVEAESNHQIDKWGIQTHSAFKWLTILTEEVGSLAKAILEHEQQCGTKEKVVSEAIQVATVALKIAEMFEKGEKS